MSERDSKKYFWLKLKKDFFQQHQIKVLKAMPNGRLYALIYLELLAESTSHNGELRFSETLPYDIPTLASVIDEKKKDVENAIKVLEELELIEILEDKTIFLQEIQKLIGSETGNAQRKREYREKPKGGTLSHKCPLENRDKSIEIRDKSIDNIHCQSEIDETSKSKTKIKEKDFIDYFSKVCPSQPQIKELNDKRKKALYNIIDKYGLQDLDNTLQKVEASDFLSGRDGKWKQCGFDWILKPTNYVKIREGNYDNKNSKQQKTNKTGGSIDILNEILKESEGIRDGTNTGNLIENNKDY